MRSKRGAASRNASRCARVQNFMTYSTPARLYQLRLNRTISWAAGRCLTKRWKYHSVSSRSLGLPGATIRTSRGLKCAAMRFMVPSLPAASRPSRITSTLRPRSMTCRCSLTSSICRRRNSRAYCFLSTFGMGSIRLFIVRTPVSARTHSCRLRADGSGLRREGRRPSMTKSSSGPRVVISNNGPYLVSGDVPLAKQTIVTDREGESQQWRQGDGYPAQEWYQLCRCGKSKTKPFCDGTHEKIGFDGTETAPRTTYREQAQVLEGPVLALTDAQSLCAGARFCDPNGQVWNQVERTEDAELRTTFLRQVNNCPAGRLVAWGRARGKP